LLGYIANENETALQFLKEIVSQNEDWRVQEILAMAFDSFCKTNGYEQSISVIEEWLSFKYANTRRAVTEGLRIWTSRPFFKEYPEKAIALLAPLRNDESEYVRKSVGNALKDISKKHSELVVEELKTWDLSDKSINQVYKLATKYIK
ncbi:DNA alkylation repair protein, partial [Clostridium butyricum]